MEEIWKIYKETNSYKGHRIYEVSNFGRIRINGVIAQPKIHRGYYSIGSIGVHRAVAQLFVSNPENKPEVDHIDNNKLNNRADNLRWVTHKENMNNPLTLQRNRETHSSTKYGELYVIGNKHKFKSGFNYKGAVGIAWNTGMKGKYVWVNNGKVMTTAPLDQAEELIHQGWQYGMLKKEKS